MVDYVRRKRVLDATVVEILTRVYKLPIEKSLEVWETSESRRIFFDVETEDLTWVSPARMAEECMKEVNKDPTWFSFSFE